MTIIDALLMLAGFCMLFAAALVITALLWRTGSGREVIHRLVKMQWIERHKKEPSS